MPSLPVLDLRDLDDPTKAATFRADLARITHEIGFFYLVGTGVPADLESELLAQSREFFAQNEEAKLSIHNTLSPQFRGYTRLGGEVTRGKVDWREQIDIHPEEETRAPGPGEETVYHRLIGPNLWPEQVPGLRPAAEAWQAALSTVARRLLRAWAAALGADEEYFDKAFGEPFPLLKIVRYPASQGESQGVGAHNDAGVVTLLWLEPGSTGLQVQLPTTGEWIDAPPLEGAFVVNIGEMLELCSGGYLRATLHRVVAPVGRDRISIPFFFNPGLDQVLPIIDLPPELKAKARGVTNDPKNPYFEVFGMNVLKNRLRSHPDVAEIHHADLVAKGVAGSRLWERS